LIENLIKLKKLIENIKTIKEIDVKFQNKKII